MTESRACQDFLQRPDKKFLEKGKSRIELDLESMVGVARM